MVIAGVMIDEKDESKLRKIGVKDSKMLTPHQRERLFPLIKKIAKDYVALKISAKEIDELRKIKNLNIIEAEKMAQIIKTMGADKAYVDTPQASTGKFKAILLNLAKNHTEIIAENYCDETYPVCSAASVPYDERILAIDNSGKLESLEIGVIVKKIKNGEILFTFSFDPNDLKIKKFRITNAIEHPPKKIYEILLEYGKKIRITGDHSIFTISNSKIVPIEVRKLKIGDYVCVANKLPSNLSETKTINIAKLLYGYSTNSSSIYLFGSTVKKIFARFNLQYFYKKAKKLGYSHGAVRTWRNRSYIPLHILSKEILNNLTKQDFLKHKFSKPKLPVIVNLEESLLWLLGIYVAEGSMYFGKKGVSFSITNSDINLQKKIKKILEKYNINVSIYKSNVSIMSILLAKLFKALGVGIGARNKRVPQITFSLNRRMIKSFLDGYLEGDGWFADNAWNAKTSSEKLANDLETLWLMLNKNTAKYFVKADSFWQVRELSKSTTGLSPDNVPINGIKNDIINLHKKINLSGEKICKLAGISHDVFGSIKRGKNESVYRNVLLKILNVFSKFVDKEDESLKNLKLIANSDISWIKIKDIKIKNSQRVFDLEVRPNGKSIENFMSSQGILLHNSIIAKIERDKEVEKIKKIVGFDFGVGYSHDQRSIEFVKKCLKEKKHLEFIRHSWITVDNLKSKKEQKSLKEYK